MLSSADMLRTFPLPFSFIILYSYSIAKYSQGFITSVVLDNDIVPRCVGAWPLMCIHSERVIISMLS